MLSRVQVDDDEARINAKDGLITVILARFSDIVTEMKEVSLMPAIPVMILLGALTRSDPGKQFLTHIGTSACWSLQWPR